LVSVALGLSLISLEEALNPAPVEPKLLSGLTPSLPSGFSAKSFSDSFLEAFSNTAVLGLLESSCGWLVWAVLRNWSVKFLAGGQARVDLGMVLGMASPMKGSERISWRVGRLEGSSTRIFEIRFLALSEMVTCSGKA
jgi:hypothetical protein